MDKTTEKDIPPKFGFKNLFAIFLIVLTLFFLWRYLSPPGLPVEEILSNPDKYIGTVITVRGIATSTIIESTLNECEPFSCDCNYTAARYLILGPKDNSGSTSLITEKSIFINALDCRGNECSMQCEYFVHKIGDEYSFTGILDDTNWDNLSLESVNLNRSMNKVGWVWLPVQTLGGNFDLK